MNLPTTPVPADLYSGCGYALAAYSNAKIVALAYLAEHDDALADALRDDEEGAHGDFFARTFLNTEKGRQLRLQLEAIPGVDAVRTGMCSSTVFVPLNFDR
jgi:hypothetical protein